MTRRLATCLVQLLLSRGPLARRRERAARAAIGMPVRHPERITAELRRRDEDWLAAVAASLWPDDEYAEIIRGTRPGSWGEGQ